MEGSVRHEAVDRRGRPVILALESDPLEVLRMGQYFGTCLSFSGENFASAVLNAVDANKQVLYARGEEGQVHGRCLLALNRARELICFNAYHHDSLSDFPALAGAYVESLARHLGVPVSAGGKVDDLHQGDWYDDGPVDVSGRFAFLKQGSEFRESLARISAPDLMQCLADESGQDPPGPFLLSKMLEVSEVLTRPELVLTVVQAMGETEEHTHESRLSIARVLWRVNEPERALHWLELLVTLCRRRRGLNESWLELDLAKTLVEVGNFSAALFVLRTASRPRGPEEVPTTEWNPEWHAVHGAACEGLSRARKALQSYRRALAMCRDTSWSLAFPDDLGPRIAQLEQVLGRA